MELQLDITSKITLISTVLWLSFEMSIVVVYNECEWRRLPAIWSNGAYGILPLRLH